MKINWVLLPVAVGVFVSVSTAAAEKYHYRYIDDAGSIHWVDSAKKVPRRYRKQLAGQGARVSFSERSLAQRAKSLPQHNRRITFKQPRPLSRGGMRNVWRPRGGSFSGF